MKAMVKFFVIAIITLVLSSPTFGQSLTEDFNYALGTAITSNGWTAHSAGGTNPITVSSGLIYSGYSHSAIGGAAKFTNTGEDVNKTFTLVSSGSVYVSAMIKLSATQTTGDYFFHIGNNPISTSFYCRVFVQKEASTSNYRIGLTKIGAVGSAAWTPYSYSPNTTYFIVLKYTFITGATNDSAFMFINPTLGGTEPAVTLAATDVSATDLAAAGSVAIRQGTNTNAPSGKIDGILVGTTWESVTSYSVPLPAIGVDGGPFSFGYTKTNTSTTAKSFTVEGFDLQSDITITPPAGFQVRTGSNEFSGSPIVLTKVGSSVPLTTVDVRFSPTLNQSYSATVLLQSTNASDAGVIVSGIGCNKASASTGNWSVGSTWTDNSVPLTTDNVLIAPGHTVTVDDATAVGNSISFTDTTGFLTMGAATSILSVYGDFAIESINHPVFTSWAAGAKLKFTGSATQTISGFNPGTPTYPNACFMEMIVDKTGGKVMTGGGDMNLVIGTTLEIINGTFEISASDDLMGRDIAGVKTLPTLTVQSGGIFTIKEGATQINSGSGVADSAFGKMIVYGQAELTSTSTAKLSFSDIDVENGGTLRLLAGFSSNPLRPHILTIKSGGTLRYSTTGTAIWDNTATFLDLLPGSLVYITTSTAITLPTSVRDNGSTFRYALSTGQTGLLGRTYTNLELSGGGDKTLAGAVTVNGTLSIMGTAKLLLGTGTLTYGASAILQYGASGQTSPQITTEAEFPTINGPKNLTIYNSGGVTLNGSKTIEGSLTLTNGLLYLGDNFLTLGPSAVINGTPSVTNMIVADYANCEIRKQLSANLVTPFTFPIGDGLDTKEYSPLTFTNLTAGSFTDAYIGVRVVNGSHPSNPSSTDYLRRFWVVSSNGLTNPNYSAQFNYVEADINGTEANLNGAKYNGITWSNLGPVNASGHFFTALNQSSFSDFTACGQSGVTVNFGTAKDWNLLSVPVVANNMSKGALFPNSISNAYWYNNSYITEDTLSMGKGYWLKFDSIRTQTVTGIQKTSNVINLNNGWNLIGTLHNSIPTSSVVTTPPNILATPFYGYENGYSSADTLKKGMGYWIKTNQAGTLTLTSLLTKGNYTENLFKINDKWTKIIITDFEGFRQELYLADESIEGNFELPPTPPAEIMDVRYSSNRMVESEKIPQLITMKNVKYPVNISISSSDSKKFRITDGIDEKQIDKTISGNESISITNSKLNTFKIAKISIPTTLALGQNYPNPFNPSTIIEFSIPEPSKVKIEIFNLLGQKVFTLLDEFKTAGYYKKSYDISNSSDMFSSGTYFYVLEANNQRIIKKMLLLK